MGQEWLMKTDSEISNEMQEFAAFVLSGRILR